MKLITTSAAALTLLVTAAPFAAFADDSSSATVQAHDQVQLTLPGGHGRGDILPVIGTDASSSNTMRTEHMGSTTMNHGTGMNGDGAKARQRGDTEIDARITSLNKMLARVGDMVRLSADEKASLTATLNTQIANLTTLKTQIDTGATTTLKTDDQSITKDFRIYALVMPKAAITAASDRIMTIVGQMQTLSGKIGTRISAAQAAGTDVSAAVAAHTDFDAKVADASVQAQAAATEVANLAVDSGVTATLQANTAALKDAKTKIDAAQADLKAARADVNTILKAVKGKGEAKVSAQASASAQ